MNSGSAGLHLNCCLWHFSRLEDRLHNPYAEVLNRKLLMIIGQWCLNCNLCMLRFWTELLIGQYMPI